MKFFILLPSLTVSYTQTNYGYAPADYWSIKTDPRFARASGEDGSPLFCLSNSVETHEKTISGDNGGLVSQPKGNGGQHFVHHGADACCPPNPDNASSKPYFSKLKKCCYDADKGYLIKNINSENCDPVDQRTDYGTFGSFGDFGDDYDENQEDSENSSSTPDVVIETQENPSESTNSKPKKPKKTKKPKKNKKQPIQTAEELDLIEPTLDSFVEEDIPDPTPSYEQPKREEETPASSLDTLEGGPALADCGDPVPDDKLMQKICYPGNIDPGVNVYTEGSSCEFYCPDDFTILEGEAVSDPDYGLDTSDSMYTCYADAKWRGVKPKCCLLEGCPTDLKVDFYFILDASKSIGPDNFQYIREYVIKLVSALPIGQDAVRVGILTYNEMPHTESHIAFNDYDNVDDLVVAIQNIPYKGKGTNTNSAVEWATQVGMTEAMGDRPNVKNFVVILTDGRAEDNVALGAPGLHEKGMIIVIGVGNKVREKDLYTLAGPGNEDNVYRVQNFRSLAGNGGGNVGRPGPKGNNYSNTGAEDKRRKRKRKRRQITDMLNFSANYNYNYNYDYYNESTATTQAPTTTVSKQNQSNRHVTYSPPDMMVRLSQNSLCPSRCIYQNFDGSYRQEFV